MNRVKNNIKEIIIIILLLLGIILPRYFDGMLTEIVYYGNQIGEVSYHSDLENKISKVDLSKVNKLMIVAHPDDEFIWGGDHLINGDYLVVCLTNGNNGVRSGEYLGALKSIDTQGIILNYPDKISGKPSLWYVYNLSLKRDVKYLITLKNWEEIATHNPNGEYGHVQHKKISQDVTKEVIKRGKESQLMYFGHYIKRKDMPPKGFPNEIKGKRLKKKLGMTKYYGSQIKVIDKLSHMLPYENWISYSNWQ